MNGWIGLLALSAVVAAVPFSLFAQATAPNPGAPAPATQATAMDIPVRRVVLYSSGVGYFEHAGTVTGDTTAALRFKTAQMGDILKSLLLQDEKGVVSLVSYPSSDPLSKQLQSFQIDVSSAASLGDLLKQLRGSAVEIQHLSDGAIEGTILGVENQPRPTGKEGATIQAAILSLVTEEGLRAYSLLEVRSLRLKDPRLQEELTEALKTLAQARNQDKKPITLRFQGEGERRVRVGYVIEAPVWKTSYRLLLPDQADDPAQLQGWAIVENQTDSDWDQVDLSLVSGRPISFAMDLYSPLYLARPVVQPELYASLRPQQYAEGQVGAMAETPTPSAALRKQDGTGGRVAMNRNESRMMSSNDFLMDAAASIQSAASGAAVGELFEYAIQAPVTLKRQKSAMIPIITDQIDAERLSIYNPAVLPRNPLTGARLKNTTGKHLLTGPITVLVDGRYAGDATIGSIPPGQDRLISYGIDQQVLVDPQDKGTDSRIQTGKIVKGVLELTNQTVATTRYEASNKGEHKKTLLIEHPRRSGWELVEPDKAVETTDALYRFELPLAPGKSTEFTVKQRTVTAQTIALLDLDDARLVALVRDSELPAKVRDALAQAAALKQKLADAQREVQQTEVSLNRAQQDQGRIRENLRTVSRDSAFYAQQMQKMTEMEKQIEDQQSALNTLRDRAQTERAALEQYLAGLSIE